MSTTFDTRPAAEQQRTLTFGEQLCGVDFNPAGHEKVKRLKALAAEMADIVHGHDSKPEVAGEHSAYLNSTFKGQAIRSILDAQMWAVKHVTNTK